MLFAGVMVAQAQMPTDNSYLRENYKNSKTAQRAAEKKAIKEARKEAKKAAKEAAKKQKEEQKALANTQKAQNKSQKTQTTTQSTKTQPVIYVKTKEGNVTTSDKAKQEAVAKMSTYLEGAVPTTAEGIVYFEKQIPFTCSKQQAYTVIKDLAEEKINASKHLGVSRIISESGDTLVANISEPIYFKRKKWESDSTVMKYQYLTNVKDNVATVRIWFISYCYEQNPALGFNYKAEEWITDNYGLTKDKLSLSKVTGKFRRKTIDYTDEIFATIEERLKQQK